VVNDGRMRMIVGCTLEEPEVRAIEIREKLRDTVEARLKAAPLRPAGSGMAEAL
jgi:hypothetical protein